MSARRIAVAVIAALVIATLGISGCAKKAPQAATTPQVTTQPALTTPTPTPEASTTTPPTPTSPVTTPVAGSGERTALLNAVRKKLGTTSQLYVYQLYVLGDTAIADVEPVSGDGQRSFVALANGPKWTAVWAAPFGSSKANKASATAALPAFSSDLIDKVGWTVAKPPVTSEASMRASLSVNAKKWVENDIGSGQGQPYKITTLKVAKDSKGVWWGVITIQPGVDASGQPFEPYRYWAKFSDGAWSEQFLGTEPPAPSSYFPASVISKLGL